MLIGAGSGPNFIEDFTKWRRIVVYLPRKYRKKKDATIMCSLVLAGVLSFVLRTVRRRHFSTGLDRLPHGICTSVVYIEVIGGQGGVSSQYCSSHSVLYLEYTLTFSGVAVFVVVVELTTQEELKDRTKGCCSSAVQ